jgi:hypothetical protein
VSEPQPRLSNEHRLGQCWQGFDGSERLDQASDLDQLHERDDVDDEEESNSISWNSSTITLTGVRGERGVRDEGIGEVRSERQRADLLPTF